MRFIGSRSLECVSALDPAGQGRTDIYVKLSCLTSLLRNQVKDHSQFPGKPVLAATIKKSLLV